MAVRCPCCASAYNMCVAPTARSVRAVAKAECGQSTTAGLVTQAQSQVHCVTAVEGLHFAGWFPLLRSSLRHVRRAEPRGRCAPPRRRIAAGRTRQGSGLRVYDLELCATSSHRCLASEPLACDSLGTTESARWGCALLSAAFIAFQPAPCASRTPCAQCAQLEKTDCNIANSSHKNQKCVCTLSLRAVYGCSAVPQVNRFSLLCDGLKFPCHAPARMLAVGARRLTITV